MSEIEPYENTFTLEDLRKEVRRQWDTRNAFVKALKELPEVPDWRVLKLLSRAAKFPEDWESGKRMQRKHGLDAIAPRTEYEMGAGLWFRIYTALSTPKGGLND